MAWESLLKIKRYGQTPNMFVAFWLNWVSGQVKKKSLSKLGSLCPIVRYSLLNGMAQVVSHFGIGQFLCAKITSSMFLTLKNPSKIR